MIKKTQAQIRKEHGVRNLSTSEQKEKMKGWPKVGEKMSPYHEAIKRKLINKGHGYLRD